MKMRRRSHLRPGSIWLLVVLVFAGMILTTLAQAEMPATRGSTPYLEVSAKTLNLGPLFSLESSSVQMADEAVQQGRPRSWLLADGLKGIYHEGLFRVHISGLRAGPGGHGGAHTPGRMELILTAGSLAMESSHEVDEADELLTNLIGNYRLMEGEVFAISLGRRW